MQNHQLGEVIKALNIVNSLKTVPLHGLKLNSPPKKKPELYYICTIDIVEVLKRKTRQLLFLVIFNALNAIISKALETTKFSFLPLIATKNKAFYEHPNQFFLQNPDKKQSKSDFFSEIPTSTSKASTLH